MTDLVTWMTDIFAVGLGTIGTTEITLGLILSFGLVVSLVLSVYRRIRSR